MEKIKDGQHPALISDLPPHSMCVCVCVCMCVCVCTHSEYSYHTTHIHKRKVKTYQMERVLPNHVSG